MKKRVLPRVIDLVAGLKVARKEIVPLLLSDISNCVVDYNELMEMYENSGRIKSLFILMGNTEAGMFQHLPLFCRHFGISLYKIVDRVDEIPKRKMPHLIGVKAEHRSITQLDQFLLS
ncbi:hypothetical protein NEHOM01_2140 [Nematocida homosporus]|uniref:uncharacterized protein n=1 Tax=Nematocida homosporus TaxID=1912981 RepID=UPI002220B2E7|nr:uncharacterized protein NEHOM01_2140 [Nematocida homosporus]KAI5187390.1 hypothetical protein NEHOM01_2140 [Nematocida homosporus]